MPGVCRHREIQTWVIEDTGEPAGLWSCKTCGLKFASLASSRAAALEEAAQIAEESQRGDSRRQARQDTARRIAEAIRERV